MNKILAGLVLAFALIWSLAAAAQDAPAQPSFKTEELQQLVAPIALYPDDLLTNVLVASTYPLEVVQAARWRKEPTNAKLKGDALVKALEAKDWDPSVKGLVQVPDVLQTMSDKLEWTQKLGNAFLAQQDGVMDAIQFLRKKADEAGNLKSNKQQKVVKQEKVIVIQSASPEIIYVPVYLPTVVYGSWWYPSYPPYYWPPPYGGAFVSGFFWGAGFAIANNAWGWGHCNWGNHNIDIDINRYNNINVNRTKITSNKWEHNPAHRGAVPYQNKAVRDKFKPADSGPIGNKDFRGRDKGAIDRPKIEGKLKDTDHSQIKDKVGNGAGEKIRDKAGDGAGQALKDKASGGVGTNVKDKVGNRPQSAAPNSRDIARPVAEKMSPGAFDVKRGADVKRSADRGQMSRDKAISAGHSLARPKGGGGGRSGGGNLGGGGRRR